MPVHMSGGPLSGGHALVGSLLEHGAATPRLDSVAGLRDQEHLQPVAQLVPLREPLQLGESVDQSINTSALDVDAANAVRNQ